MVSLPAQASKALPYGAALRDHILGSFRGSIRPVAVSLIYQLGLVVLAIAMVLLPAAYLALVGLVAWATWLHGNNADAIFALSSKRLAGMLYVVPLLSGVIAVIFMIKPLFAPPAQRPVHRSLDRRQEPLLFAFVEHLCKVVGSPVPKRIDVDCQVNASASFRRGVWSLFGRGDLVLTLGLPLTAGLSLQQLAGVLAHEFGHFAQGAGMRLTYLIRSINNWFARVVYERDSLDEQLRVAADSDRSLALVALVAQLFVWITRRILWVLMWVGNALSSFMLRQMEFDADRYEARLVGSTTFETTCRELTRLGLSHSRSLEDLQTSWREGRLADNLPGLVRAHRGRLEAELLEALNRHTDAQSTGLFDTHPADRDRIASAQREGDAPVFRSTLPATVLFRDFGEVARRVSKDFYETNLGQTIESTDLVSLDAMLERQALEREDRLALGRFFQGAFSSLRPLPWSQDGSPPSEPTPAPDLAALVSALEQHREQLELQAPRHLETLIQLDLLDDQRLDLLRGITHVVAEVDFNPKDLQLPGKARHILDRALAQNAEQIAATQVHLEAHEARAAQRLATTLRLLDHPPLVAVDEALAALEPEVPGWLDAAERLARSQPIAHALYRAWFQLDVAGELEQYTEDHAPLRAAIPTLTEPLFQQLVALRETLVGGVYPFDHADPDLDLASYVLPMEPVATDPSGLYRLGREALERQADLRARVFGRLASLGEQLEARLGFEPLATPSPVTATGAVTTSTVENTEGVES